MNNYEYIIAGLPVLSPEDKDISGNFDADALIEQTRSLLSGSDAATLDFLLDGWKDEKLCEDFYRAASCHHCRFVRAYFERDLGVRNAKVLYLNSALGRPARQDCILLPDTETPSFEGVEEVEAALRTPDILERERRLDDLTWEFVEEKVGIQVFSIDVILAFTVKLKIIDRRLKLDPVAGRELFRRLVDEIRKQDNIV